MSNDPIDSEDYYYAMYDKPDVFEEILGTHNRRLSLSIPEEYDTYNTYDSEIAFICKSMPIAPPPSPSSHSHIKDIQTSLDYPKQVLFISSLHNRRVYKMPHIKSIDAYKIWNEAGIPLNAYENIIESQLLDWAYTYAQLEIVDRKIVSIKWSGSSNSICEASWPAFLKWILCASISSPN